MNSLLVSENADDVLTLSWKSCCKHRLPSVPHPVAMTVSAGVVGKFSGEMQTGPTMELKINGAANFRRAISKTALELQGETKHLNAFLF